MTCIAIIQARLGSTRLPRKVLEDIKGLAALGWTVRAAAAVPGIQKVVVATTDLPEDAHIAAWCKTNGVACQTGESEDVLARYVAVLNANPGFDSVVRLTADCPFLDPHVCGQVLSLYLLEGCDYASNVHPPTWPDGMDCEVISTAALRAAHAEAVKPSERQHVTSFVSSNPVRFKSRTLVCPLPGLTSHRWTLDYAEDLQFLRAVAERLRFCDRPPNFTEILDVLRKTPELVQINARPQRDESFATDVAAEGKIGHRGYQRSNAALQKALETVPLGSQTFSKSYIQYPDRVSPLFASHGRGGRIWDVDGNEYVDLVCGLLSVNLGYNDPDVDAAVREQLTRGVTFSLNTLLEQKLAELIVELVPSAEMVRFAKNGTDVTSAAVRLSRALTQRDGVIVAGYHGWQDWFIGTTTMNKGVPTAVSNLTHHVPYGDLANLESVFNKYPDKIACFILEPFANDGPPGTYLKDACDLARARGAIVIFDEIITGFRLSLGGAQEAYGVTPDLTTLGKGLANGFPLSALAGKRALMSRFTEIFFSGTFGGETLSLAAAIAVLEKIKREPVLPHIWQIGERMALVAQRRIEQFNLNDVVEVKGLAPWKSLSYRAQDEADGDELYSFVVREMAANGVLSQGTHNICYAHTTDDVGQVDVAYAATFEKLAHHLRCGSLRGEMKGQVVRSLFSVRKKQR